MKIMVKDIPSSGIELKESISPTQFDLLNEEIKIKNPLELILKVDRSGQTVLIHTQLKGIYDLVCDRCLKPYDQSWTNIFDLDYSITKSTDYIIIDEDIRQEIILAYPRKILCQENCQGICPNCGADLNREPCRCSTKK